MDRIEIPDPRTSSRVREVEVEDASAWVSPYTPEQALAIALFNNHAIGTIGDACRIAENTLKSLKPMGFTLRFTGV